MPLQIRRGTEAERQSMTAPLAAGEPLYVTDDKRLYIGDSSTPGGIAVTGYADEDAVDAVGAALVAGEHQNVTFVYGQDQDVANRIDAVVDLSNYVGEISATGFKGPLIAEDNSVVFDAIDKIVYADVIGDVTGIVTGNLNGNVIGNVTGNLSGNVVGELTGDVVGDIIGNLTGDVKGSVFADDSSLLVDAISGVFNGTVDTGNALLDTDSITSSQDFFLGTTSAPLDLKLNLNANIQIRQLINPDGGSGFISISKSRGSLEFPIAAQAGDELGGLLVKAYTDSSTEAFAGIIGVLVDPTASIAGGDFIKSQMIISAASDSSQDIADAFLLDSAGVATANAFVANKFMQFPIYADDTAREVAIPTPAAGMTVFMTSGTVPTVTNKPVIYNGTAWEAF